MAKETNPEDFDSLLDLLSNNSSSHRSFKSGLCVCPKSMCCICWNTRTLFRFYRRNWTALVYQLYFTLLSDNSYSFKKNRKEICKYGGNWLWLGVTMIASQIITIPAALLVHFKIAYIFTYIAGFFYGTRYADGTKAEEKRWLDLTCYFIAVIGLFIRFLLNRCSLSGIYDAAGDLLTQWIKLFQGAALFILIFNNIPNDKWNNASKRLKLILSKLSSYTFEVYLVHEFFMHDMFTRFLPNNRVLKLIIIWLCIAFSALALKTLEQLSACIYSKLIHKIKHF